MSGGRLRAVWAIGVVALVGCAKAPPVPVDQFYRLPEPAAALPESETKVWGELVLVGPFRANGLHTERALVFSEDPKAVTLARYHYHHWTDSPPRLVQEYLALRMRQRFPAAMVLTERQGTPATAVAGKVKRFDHHVAGKGRGYVLIALELSVNRDPLRAPVLVRDYSARVPVSGKGMTNTVLAFGQAMEEITDRFLTEATAALAGR